MIGRVGRIDFTIRWVPRQVRGQISAGGIDGRFDVARGAIDVAAQIELNGNVGAAQRTGRGHFRDARNVSELAFQGSRDRRGHDLGAGARQSEALMLMVGKSTCGNGEAGKTV